MARARIRLDHPGMAEMLRSGEVADAVSGLAESVAGHARADAAITRHGADVVVADYTTDRAATSVTIAHAAGIGIEAKHGPLTRAAGAAGLQVRSAE